MRFGVCVNAVHVGGRLYGFADETQSDVTRAFQAIAEVAAVCLGFVFFCALRFHLLLVVGRCEAKGF